MSSFLTTHVGSVPHQDPLAISETLCASLDIPAWPQLVRRSFRENMYVQYSAALPAIRFDDEAQKVSFQVDDSLLPALETFYAHYLEDDLEYFGLPESHASGFYAMLDLLGQSEGRGAKGQVTGPISLGLTVTDQNLRSALYHPELADAIAKNAAMNARWQIRRLKAQRPEVLIVVDEPYMASFGSAFIALSREEAVTLLDEVFEAIHSEGARAGVHCCANTDWSVLLGTQVDVLNLDAYGYLDNLALYPGELRAFLDRGGVIAWGAVPNSEEIDRVGVKEIAAKLSAGIRAIAERAEKNGVSIPPADLVEGCLLVPSCGLGSASEGLADRVLAALGEVAEALRS